MALDLIVENGTGVPNANSYLSIEEFQDLADMLGYDYSTFSTDDTMRKLIRSTIILESNYRIYYNGSRVTETQGLEWPREDATYYDKTDILSTVIPKEIKEATVEMVYGLENNLQPVISTAGSLREERVKVDVIEEQKKYYCVNKNDRPSLYTVEDAMSRITGGVGAKYRLTIQRV
jgi:hypothetical protein